MLKFSEFSAVLSEAMQLDEALITFGGKAYPKFGNIVIMAGGAGSGKGFIKDNLMGIEGFTFDVDALKLLSTRTPAIIDRVKKELGVDLSHFDTKKNEMALKDAQLVSRLHSIIGDHLKLDDRKKSAVFKSVMSAAVDRKPNLIFDVTLQNMKQFDKYTTPMVQMGYDPKNIHIVWIINDLKVAMEQNRKRKRTVPEDILLGTHEGAALNMREIMTMTDKLKTTANGDIVLAFNKAGVDSEYVTGDDDRVGKTKKSGYLKKANYVYIKRQGKPIDQDKLTQNVMDKIASYVPDSVSSAFK